MFAIRTSDEGDITKTGYSLCENFDIINKKKTNNSKNGKLKS